jgi:tetratricopeptide (TPR) repeat protein
LSAFLGLLNESALAQGQSATPDPDPAACAPISKNAEAAIAACTRLMEREVRTATRLVATVLTIRGIALSSTGKLQDAINDFSAAIALDQDYAPAYEARGDVLRSNNQCELAIPEYDKVITLTPNRVVTRVNRGSCLLTQNEPVRALADFDEAIKLDPANGNGMTALAWNGKARTELQKGALDPAIADYDEALRFNPGSASTYLERGSALSRKGDNDRAFADFEKATDLDAENAAGVAVSALLMKASLHAAQSNSDAAIADYDAAIKLDPHLVSLFLARAELLAGKGDAEPALADYDQAIKLDPKNVPAYNSRGGFYRERGEYAKAAADFEKAIENAPDDPTGYGNRALVRFYQGEFAKAVDDFKHVADAQANAYSMLLLYLSRSRTGRKEATPELAKSLGKLNASDWPYPVAELYVGRKSADAVLAAASTPGQKCEAQFYIGEWQLAHDKQGPATKALQAAADTCPKDFVEYRGAVEELKRLK